MTSDKLNITYEGIPQIEQAYSYISNEVAQSLPDYSNGLAYCPKDFTFALNSLYERHGGKNPKPHDTMLCTNTVAPNIKGLAEIKVLMSLAPGGMVKVEVFDAPVTVKPMYFNPIEA